MTKLSYLVFERQPANEINKKTKVWDVTSTSGNHLGQISWWGAWRQYTFRPDASTVFNPDCLREIADFCAEQTAGHRAERSSPDAG